MREAAILNSAPFLINIVFVSFSVSQYNREKFGPLIWEPMHYIRYSSDQTIMVVATDALIPGVLKSRVARLLLTKKAEGFDISGTCPLAGCRLEPLAEKPEQVLGEYKELWHTLTFSEANISSVESIDSSDMLKWQMARMGGSLLLGGKFESEITQHIGLAISTSTFKSLLETELNISGNVDLRVLDAKTIYYPLAVWLGKKNLVRDAVNRFRPDAIYSRLITSDPKVEKIFKDALSRQYGGV